MSTRVLLGKTGDLLSLLPLLWHEAQSGVRPRLMVAKSYASVLEGVSYVDPVVFDGEPMDINGAMEQARKLDPKAVCVQVAGPAAAVAKWVYVNGPPGAVCQSFEKEIWRLAGALNLWKEQYPLVFDQRSPEREEALLTDSMKRKAGRKRKVMLVHLDGKTSPFPYKETVWRFLELAFPTWEMVDLGKVKAERIYDLLGLYERADLLVASDSAPLHLAQAVPKLPVVAFTKDTPTLWHGTSWRPQHVAYCRYGDTARRLADIERRIRVDATPKDGPRIVHVFSEYE